MMARLFMMLSAGIPLVFGALHLFYTFYGTKLLPRDPGVQAAMAQTKLRITAETTVWRAWIGFNATHSLSLIIFGIVFGYLAFAKGPMLFDSTFLLVVGFAILASFVVLARLYFFSVPLAGVTVALTCYVASIFFAHT